MEELGMVSAPIIKTQQAVWTTGTAWAVSFTGLTDGMLAGGFAIECYLIPQYTIPFYITEFFVTKEAGGATSTVQIRFADRSVPNPVPTNANVTVQIYLPAP